LGRFERVLYRALNAAVGLVLRSPFHRLLSSRILLLTVVGRKSGRTFDVPVGYVRRGDGFLLFTGVEWSAWWKNLRGGAPVTVRVGGRPLTATARAETCSEAGAGGLQKFLAKYPRTARRYRVGLDTDGRPDPRDVDAAVREGRAVMILVER